jgi:hypothetical protein
MSFRYRRATLRNHPVGLECREDLAVDPPAIQNRVGIPTQVGRLLRRRLLFEHLLVTGSADHYAGMAMASQHDAGRKQGRR